MSNLATDGRITGECLVYKWTILSKRYGLMHFLAEFLRFSSRELIFCFGAGGRRRTLCPCGATTAATAYPYSPKGAGAKYAFNTRGQCGADTRPSFAPRAVIFGPG